MKLSEEQIRSFIQCWKADFGEVLTPEQAEVESMRLLEFFGTVAAFLRSQTGASSRSKEANQ